MTTELAPSIIAEHGLSPAEYARIVEILGREPTLVELGIFSVMWSEHCSYKSSKHWLRQLPTDGPQVICGPGENAGVVDLGQGMAAVFKIESHNHPSYIEPYQGAATGVGGILRDVFTMGARPVALLNALRFGAPEHPKTRHLVDGVVAGIAGYGNCIGVPTVGGETGFHQRLQRQHPGQRDVRRPGAPRTRSSMPAPPAPATRWSTSAPRPGATASTARPWPRPSSAPRPKPGGRPCRSATRSPRSCCSRPASS